MAIVSQSTKSSALPSGLRTLFLVHGLNQIGFGAALVAVPTLLLGLIGWGQPVDLTMSRLAGAFLIGLGVGQVLAYRAETWNEVWLLFVTVLTEAVVGFVAVLYLASIGTLSAGWLLLPMFVVFTTAFLWYARIPFGSGDVSVTKPGPKAN